MWVLCLLMGFICWAPRSPRCLYRCCGCSLPPCQWVWTCTASDAARLNSPSRICLYSRSANFHPRSRIAARGGFLPAKDDMFTQDSCHVASSVYHLCAVLCRLTWKLGASLSATLRCHLCRLQALQYAVSWQLCGKACEGPYTRPFSDFRAGGCSFCAT